jgi:hypothetical protein
MCWVLWGPDEEDGADTDLVAAGMAAESARVLASAVETSAAAPRAAREPPLIATPERSHARYATAMRRMTSGGGRDAVSLAAYFDDASMMKVFVRDRSIPSVLFEDALKLAVVQGNVRVVEVLMSSGAAQGGPGARLVYRAPFRLAALRGNKEVFATIARYTRLERGESLARVTQDILLDGAGRTTVAMLVCLWRISGGQDPVHWKDALVAAAHTFHRPLVIRLCLAFDSHPLALAEAVDTASFLGNAGALRVLASVPRARPPRREVNPVRARVSRGAEVVVRQLRARVLLYRRNGLQRAILAVRAFRERYYAPPSGPGFLAAAHSFHRGLKPV